jgi:hypothetical protein
MDEDFRNFLVCATIVITGILVCLTISNYSESMIRIEELKLKQLEIELHMK